MGKYRFDEIAINSTQKKKPIEEDKSHYVGLEHIDPECFEIQQYGTEVAPVGEKLVMKKGDILFGKRRAYQRKVAIAPCDGIFSAHGMVLRPQTGVIDSSYFPFFISSDTFMDTAIRISVGGLSPTINWKDLAKQEFELPSLEEQKILADKLWAAYRLKEAYKKLLVATDEMVKSQFIEMMGDFRSNPKGWKIKKLSELASYTIGLTYKPEQVCDVGTIVLRSGNIQDNQINLDDLVRVNTIIRENLWVREGDILMCSRNGSASLVGKVAQIKAVSEPMTYGAFMTVIRSEYSDFLYLYFQSANFRDQISGGKSSTMNQITQKMLDKIEFPFPDLDTISSLSSILQQADKSKFDLKQCIENIDKVIKSLING